MFKSAWASCDESSPVRGGNAHIAKPRLFMSPRGWFEEEVTRIGFINMGVFSAKPGKEDELRDLLKSISQYMKGNPDKFTAVKSRRLCSRYIGGVFGEYVDMWEFGSWEEYAQYEKIYAADSTYAGYWKELFSLIEPSTHSWTNLVEVEL